MQLNMNYSQIKNETEIAINYTTCPCGTYNDLNNNDSKEAALQH